MVRASVAVVLCTTRLVTRVETCALRRSGVKSRPCELLNPLTLLSPSSGVRGSVVPVLCKIRLVTGGPAGVGESPRRSHCGACRSAVKSPLTSFPLTSFPESIDFLSCPVILPVTPSLCLAKSDCPSVLRCSCCCSSSSIRSRAPTTLHIALHQDSAPHSTS